MRKTKIVCTLGPSTDKEGVLRDMICAGMNVARFNFSHGTHEDHARRLAQLQKLRDELDMPVAALLDTKGPEIRLRDFKNGKVQLKAGQTFTLTTREVLGDENICSISYKELPQDVCPGARILLDDGLIALTVNEIDGGDIVCTVKNDGPVSNHKGVNVPDVHLSMPYMTAQDKDDIRFGVEQGFDFIAASFVRSAADVLEIRRVLDECKCDFIKIIAKIENREGVNNIEEILAVSDGIMVARGDMGVEIDFTEIPIIQKDIIWRCYNAGKPVITATQMLESMMEHPRPTRAEITDVANAIYDGTCHYAFGRDGSRALARAGRADDGRHCLAHGKRHQLRQTPAPAHARGAHERGRRRGPRRMHHGHGYSRQRHYHRDQKRRDGKAALQIPPKHRYSCLHADAAGVPPAFALVGHHAAVHGICPQYR